MFDFRMQNRLADAVGIKQGSHIESCVCNSREICCHSELSSCSGGGKVDGRESYLRIALTLYLNQDKGR